MRRHASTGALVPPPPGMRAALAAARRGGHVSPNPLVGACLLVPGRPPIVAWHARFGGAHAEARLLDRAAAVEPLPSGSVLYLTLEPCTHQGKTPPCVDRVIAARPERVVVAVADPDPRVNGRGLVRLRRAGIKVDVGPGAGEAIAENLGFHLRHRLGRPAVVLKLGSSLDARLARSAGRRRITGREAMAQVHRERARADAVLAGSGTILADRPKLNVRAASGPQPTRIVVDSGLRIPARGSVWRAWKRDGGPRPGRARMDATPESRCGNYVAEPTRSGTRWTRRPRLVVATARESARRRGDEFRHAGWEIWEFPTRGGHVPLDLLLARAAREGFLRVLAEAGPRLAGALLEADLVDEISLYVAPAVLGGETVWPPAAAPRRGTSRVLPERRFEYVDQRRLGEDLWVRLRRRGRIERLAGRIERLSGRIAALNGRARRRPA